MHLVVKSAFDAEAFLTSAGSGRSIVELRSKQTFFLAGEAANFVFYLQSGRAKQTVVSKSGKEATITFLSAGEFLGEESLAATGALHTSTATSMTDCSALKIEREVMLHVMREEYSLYERFIKYLLARGMRIQSDLVDQLFNSVERSLARILLLMTEFGDSGASETLLPEISEEALAEMIGSTPARVSFFMNNFNELGLIKYDGRIRVHKELLNVFLHDQFPDDNAVKPAIIEIPQKQSKMTEHIQ
jgi:CRP/FNR family cyclic AMP-dependent transcriptional regulator